MRQQLRELPNDNDRIEDWSRALIKTSTTQPVRALGGRRGSLGDVDVITGS